MSNVYDEPYTLSEICELYEEIDSVQLPDIELPLLEEKQQELSELEMLAMSIDDDELPARGDYKRLEPLPDLLFQAMYPNVTYSYA